jgi:hypothetical protein
MGGEVVGCGRNAKLGRPPGELSWPAEEWAAEAIPLAALVQRADARWLGGSIKWGMTIFYISEPLQARRL